MATPAPDLAAAPSATHLTPTWFVDSDDDAVRNFAQRVTAGAGDERDRVSRLFAAVRDQGFSDVRNHLQSDRLAERMGTDVFVFHGYTDLFIDGVWRKATPAFNASLCAWFGVPPLEFDGTGDALLHAFTGDGDRHMEYIRDRGVWSDLPLGLILDTLRTTYPALLTTPATHDRAFADE